MFQPTHAPSAIAGSFASDAAASGRAFLVSTAANNRKQELFVIGAGLIALALKLVIASNTIGTNDVIALYHFGNSVSQHGLHWTYQNTIAFNHPPLSAYLLQGIYRLSNLPSVQQFGLTFPFLVRVPGIIADFVSVLVVLAIVRSSDFKVPAWIIYLFALSPVSLMVTGFHGNTDPIMVLFFILAVYMAFKERAVACGLFFALSCHIKIVPLLFLPILVFFWMARGSFLQFSLAFAASMLSLWCYPLLAFPSLFVKNVLSYGSFWGLWGITYWLRLTGWSQFARVTFHHFSEAQVIVATLLKLLIIAAIILIGWRRRNGSAETLCHSIGYAWIIFFVFSPGVCAQYMVWLAPFVLLLSSTLYNWLTLASALFLFFFYNTIADRFPWYLGISGGEHNEKWLPWSIWPWAILIAALILMWRNAFALNPALLSAQTRNVCHNS
ncbi:MAG TPA: glycosyltransferase 87 family protein [Candidatus Udaeobacter sp.]|nr:glycosyltransferase 87 family protein [Candidatus Udaeobacter sp.]